MTRFVAAVLGLAAMGLVIVAMHPWARAQSTTMTAPALTAYAGHDIAQPGCLTDNGWNVCNFGDATIKDSYLRYKTYLGSPVSGFDARCQTFELGRLCYNPANATDWQIEFDNLGLADLVANGRTPRPGATPAPAVRDWLLAASEVGVDPWRVAGRILGDPVCQDGQCKQWADKTLFQFPQGATAASQVSRAPLGTWATHPAAPSTAAPSTTTEAWLPVAGVLAAILLALVLVTRRRGRSTGRAVTL